MDLIPYIVIPLVILGVAYIKYRDVKKKQNHPPRKWEGEASSANDKRWQDAHKEGAKRGTFIGGGGGGC